MLTLIALAATLATQTPARTQDGPIVTGGSNATAESAAEVRLREALAYSNPLPRGAPTQDYPLVAWCDALVTGHVALGETLTDRAPEDLEIMRLGRLEAQDFRAALLAAESRVTPAQRQAATLAVAEASGRWDELLSNPDEAVRSQAFGLFFGLPGRCEHAARRIRENITTPPASLADVGLRSEGVDPVE